MGPWSVRAPTHLRLLREPSMTDPSTQLSPETAPCKHCGKIIVVTSMRKAFCSRSCVKAFQHVNVKPIRERLLENIKEVDGCWVFTGALNTTGYGRLSVTRDGKKKRIYTHRLSWEIHFGPIPEGQDVLHHCDNRPCIRPDHLFLGNNADNVKDR